MLFKGLFGSHLYSLATEDSDKDYKGIYMPSTKEIILGKAKKNITMSTGDSDSKNAKDDVDTEIFSLQEFVKLACQGQTVAIDMLHTPISFTYESSPQWEYLVNNRHLFYSKNMNAFMGYVKKQAAKYGAKGSRVSALENLLEYLNKEKDYPSLHNIEKNLPVNEYFYWEESIIKSTGVVQKFYVVNGSKMHNVISVPELRERVQKQYDGYGARAKQAASNEGIDWKSLSHCLRVAYQLRDIYKEGDFQYPLKETEYLLEVKQGKRDYLTDVSEEINSVVEEVQELSALSFLPVSVDTDFWDDWIYTEYLNRVVDV